MSRERTVLVLGAYGLIGREVVRFLVEKTEAEVIAGGRKRERLEGLAAELNPDRVRPGCWMPRTRGRWLPLRPRLPS